MKQLLGVVFCSLRGLTWLYSCHSLRFYNASQGSCLILHNTWFLVIATSLSIRLGSLDLETRMKNEEKHFRCKGPFALLPSVLPTLKADSLLIHLQSQLHPNLCEQSFLLTNRWVNACNGKIQQPHYRTSSDSVFFLVGQAAGETTLR